MGAASEWGRVTRGTIAGLLYGTLLALLSFAAAGAGHGTGFPFLVSSAPFGLLGMPAAVFGAPLLWAAVGALVADSGRVIRPVAVLYMHYVSGVVLMLAYFSLQEVDPEDLDSVEQISPESIFIWVIVYLVGQAVVWRRILVK